MRYEKRSSRCLTLTLIIPVMSTQKKMKTKPEGLILLPSSYPTTFHKAPVFLITSTTPVLTDHTLLTLGQHTTAATLSTTITCERLPFLRPPGSSSAAHRPTTKSPTT